jgi:hypothetical protein
MSHRLIAAGLVPLAALAMTAGTALAGGSTSKPKAPTATQKSAILKSAGFKGPAKCYSVALSSRKQTVAGVMFNGKASGCTKYGFDGSSLYYGNSAKTAWYLLDAASSETANHCDALKILVGTPAWQDLAGYASGLGCTNVD